VNSISRFAYDLRPTRVLFAPGALYELSSELDALGVRRALVISTPGRAAELPAFSELLGEKLVDVFDGAVEHVPTGVVATALDAARRCNADVCVSVGGGSAIGLGKAIARETGLPLVAVPTTYSGSEMTSIWGVTDHSGKRTGRDPRVAPRAVVYDPDLTLGLSPAVSAASGMNAMAHAVEALYAANASPITLAIAEEAVPLLTESLPRVFANPGDRDARSAALAGAHLAGRALDLAAMGLHHRLCHVLGGTFGLPHARTHAAILPYVLAFNAPAAPSAMRRLGRALNTDDPVGAIVALGRTLRVATPLADLGLHESDVERAVDEATASPYPNPRQATREEVRAILIAALLGDDENNNKQQD